MTMRKLLARRRPASLALRVTALVGIATTVVFLTFHWIIVRALEHHFAEQDAGELQAVAHAVSATFRQARQAGDEAELHRQLAAIATGHHGVSYGVFDAAGRAFHASPGPDLSPLAATGRPAGRIDADNLLVWREADKSYRGVVLRADADAPAYRVVAAMDIDFHLEFLEAFKRILWWATAIVLLFALAVAWLAVQWGHMPIRKATREIRTIRSSRLHVRLNPLDVPIELQELAISFNDMLGRIEDGFSKLSYFSADIAHELRTPVTNLITQTQVALSQPRGADEYREVLYSNLEELDRMSRMIGDMLFLAQTENDPHNLHLSEIDLETLLLGLFDYFEALAEDAGITLRLEGSAAPIRADREMLMRALSNLLSNAIRYTPRGACVTVRLAQDQRGTSLCVENPGERIPESVLPMLFERFFRADPARRRKSAGAGLGLAIVKSIAEAHGGEVEAASTEALTRFELVLPPLQKSPPGVLPGGL